MFGVLSVFLITLGLGQLLSTYQGWRAASLVGPRRLAGYGLGLLLLGVGAWLLPASWFGLGWTPLAGLLSLILLLAAGSTFDPPPHPDGLFEANSPAHNSCLRVQIPDGDSLIPGFLLTPPLDPPRPPPGEGVLIVHGAGDTKTSYKWRLVEALLAEGFIVLTIDLPGHGEYRQRPLAYPDCLSVIPAALRFFRAQPEIKWVGLVGISLGSALALASLTHDKDPKDFPKPLGSMSIDALAALETPLTLNYNRGLFYGEMWHAYRAPVLSLFSEVSVKQLRQSWFTGGYVSRHKNTGEIISLLAPLESIRQLPDLPILLVHGGRDSIAPPEAGRVLQQAAPQAKLLIVPQASHVTLTLMREVNQQVARWLERMADGGWRMADGR